MLNTPFARLRLFIQAPVQPVSTYDNADMAIGRPYTPCLFYESWSAVFYMSGLP